MNMKRELTRSRILQLMLELTLLCPRKKNSSFDWSICSGGKPLARYVDEKERTLF